MSVAARQQDGTARGASVTLHGITRSFGETSVLEGVDLEIKPGEFVAIIGQSGSGKSTLLRCINFLEQPSNGTIKLNGEKLRTVFDKKGNLKVVEPKHSQSISNSSRIILTKSPIITFATSCLGNGILISKFP